MRLLNPIFKEYDLASYNLDGQAPYEQDFHPQEVVASDVTDINEVDVIIGICDVTYIVNTEQENGIKNHFGKDSYFCKKVLRTEVRS